MDLVPLFLSVKLALFTTLVLLIISIPLVEKEIYEDLLPSSMGGYIFKLFYIPILLPSLPYFNGQYIDLKVKIFLFHRHAKSLKM